MCCFSCRSSKEGNDEAGEKPKRMVSQGTSTDELVVIPKKKTSVEQTKMLARRYQYSPKFKSPSYEHSLLPYPGSATTTS